MREKDQKKELVKARKTHRTNRSKGSPVENNLKKKIQKLKLQERRRELTAHDENASPPTANADYYPQGSLYQNRSQKNITTYDGVLDRHNNSNGDQPLMSKMEEKGNYN